MNLTAMDYIRAALANAMAEDLDLADIWQAIEQAETPAAFDENVNAIVQARDAMGQTQKGKAYCGGHWIEID